MFTKLFAGSLLIAGCTATQGFSTLPQEGHPTGVTLSLDTAHVAMDDAPRWFPAMATEAALPSAQPLRTALFSTGQDRFAIGVRVCVTPDGTVSHVDLQQSSGIAELDQAALHDIAAWRYEQFAGPVRVQTCEPMTLNYAPE